MKKALLILGSITVIAVMLLAAVRLIDVGVFSSGPVNGSLPPHIVHVIPGDGERVGETFGFCVHFVYKGSKGMGNEPQDSVRYIIDGRNVSDQMHDLVGLEYPTHVEEPCYRRSEPLKSGWHTIKVDYEDIFGVHYEYKWRFLVVDDS